MRLLDVFPAVAYTDPWVIPLERRWARLWQRGLKVAYVYEKPDNSTFRYRAYNMIQALSLGRGDVVGSFFFLNELSVRQVDRLGEMADVVVLCRTRFERKLARLAGVLARHNKPLVFDVDDLVFSLDHIPILMATLGESSDDPRSLDLWYAYVSRLRATLDLCTNALCTNDFLAQLIKKIRAIKVNVLPNFMNREQLGISARLVLAKKRMPRRENENIWLGYFSGTPTHNNDFLVMADGLARCMSSDPRIHFAIVGYLNLPPSLAPYADRVQRFPFQDFVNLQRLIAAVDINLMPLQVNTFTNCKSELKYFEAGAVRTPSLASPSYSYARALKENGGGMIARAHEWADGLQEMVDDCNRLRNMGEQARSHALSRYSPRALSGRVARTFSEIVSVPSASL
jgi:glycosyltransferase involved in cell wall biosynthesis